MKVNGRCKQADLSQRCPEVSGSSRRKQTNIRESFPQLDMVRACLADSLYERSRCCVLLSRCMCSRTRVSAICSRCAVQDMCPARHTGQRQVPGRVAHLPQRPPLHGTLAVKRARRELDVVSSSPSR